MKDTYKHIGKESMTSKIKTVFNYLILAFGYLLTFYFVEWTVDMYNYEHMLSDIDRYSTDIFFTWIAKYAEQHNYSYSDVYHFHIVLQAIFFSLFSAKEFKSPILPCIITILLNFVNIANQMRFFLGFWAFLYGMTFYDKKRSIYYLLGLFACLNHITLCILFICMPLRPFLLNISKKRYFIFATILLIISPLIQVILPTFFESFSVYLEQDMQSSVLGGLFSIFPIFFFVLCFYSSQTTRENCNPDLSNNRLIETLSIFSFLFIPLSIVFQIFAHRFVFTFISLWIAYIIDENENNRTSNIFVGALSIFTIIWFYFAPLVFLGYSYYYDNVLVMIGLKMFLSI